VLVKHADKLHASAEAKEHLARLRKAEQ
jgi:hypothetical protein